MRCLLVVACLIPYIVPAARAQVFSNMEAYQTLAVQCLSQVPDTTQVFALRTPSVMPYLRTALVETWRAEGRTLYLADTDQQMARLSYAVEHAGVVYARHRNKQLRRTVRLDMHHTFVLHDGRIVDDARCSESYSDTIYRRDRLALEMEAFPETQGALPRAGWLRRYLEPIILATAGAVTVFLFFNLRSDRFQEGG